jgi:hypothetical protein
MNQTKMLIVSCGIVYWSTSSNSGASWSTFSSQTLNSGQNANIRNGCALRNDGQYGYVQTGAACYTVTWTGATPTFISFDTVVAVACTGAGYFGGSMTPDGKTLFIKVFTGALYYTRFNTTTNLYAAFTNPSITTGRLGVALNPNASVVFLANDGADIYRTITWNGDVATFSAANTSCAGHADDRAYLLVGGNSSGSVQPSYMLAGYHGIFSRPWDSTTNILSNNAYSTGTDLTVVGAQTPDTNNIYMASGAKGNIIYFANNATLYKATLNVT